MYFLSHIICTILYIVIFLFLYILIVSLTEIYKIEIKNVEKLRENIHIKGMRTDLSLNTNIGYINVEINSNPEEYVHPRNFSYLADTYSHATKVGETYNQDIKYIQINLSYGFMLTEGNKLKKNPIDKEKIRIYEVMDESGKKFIENFTIYEINMDYFLNLWYNKDTEEIKKEKILIMLGLDKNSLEELSENDKVVSKYMKEVNTINEDPEFREYISYEEDMRKIQNTLFNKGMEQGIEKGIEKGMEQGINSRNIEIAKNLMQNGVDIETIIKSTGLSKEEINKLKK